MNDETIERVKVVVQNLTPQERQVAQLIIKGYEVRDVAKHVHRVPGTVSHIIKSIGDKLGAKSRHQLGYFLQIGGLE